MAQDAQRLQSCHAARSAGELGPGLLLRPPYCLLVRRTDPQKDAARPLALERVAHAHPHTADLLQFDLTELTVLERAQALMVGATGNDVARVQGHDPAGQLEQLGVTTV